MLSYKPKGEQAAENELRYALESGQMILHFVTDSFPLVERLLEHVHFGGFSSAPRGKLEEGSFRKMKLQAAEDEINLDSNEKTVYVVNAGMDGALTANQEDALLHFARKYRLRLRDAQLQKHAGAPDADSSRDPGMRKACVAIYGANARFSPVLEASVKRIEIALPTEEEIAQTLRETYRDLEPAVVSAYTRRLIGLDIDTILQLMEEIKLAQGGSVCDFDAGREKILAYKKLALRKHNKLELYDTVLPDEAHDDPVTWMRRSGMLPLGMGNVVNWLVDHRECIRSQLGMDATKGMLLLGVPGMGKSMLAKAAASILDVPMVKLDIGRILGGRVGDSEHNMQQVLDDLKFLAPCVLFIDEMEKALSGSNGSNDSGVMTRLMGKLLEFMQDMKQTVFVIATANSVASLPPEFLRNGRFDAKYSILMPDYVTCQHILQQKLLGRGIEHIDRNPNFQENLAQTLAEKCTHIPGDEDRMQFLTGADIEALVKEMFVYYRKNYGNVPVSAICPSKEIEQRLTVCMDKALEHIVPIADENRETSLAELAAFYARVLSAGMLVTGDGDEETNFLFRTGYCSKTGKGDEILRKPNDYMSRPAYDRRLFDAVESQLKKISAQSGMRPFIS